MIYANSSSLWFISSFSFLILSNSARCSSGGAPVTPGIPALGDMTADVGDLSRSIAADEWNDYDGIMLLGACWSIKTCRCLTLSWFCIVCVLSLALLCWSLLNWKDSSSMSSRTNEGLYQSCVVVWLPVFWSNCWSLGTMCILIKSLASFPFSFSTSSWFIFLW